MNSHTYHLVLICSGVLSVLTLASMVGYAFKFRFRVYHKGNAEFIDNLNARVRAWWVMVIILLVTILLGQKAIIILFAFISLQTLREFISLTYTRRGDFRALAWSFFFFLPLQYILVSINWYGLFVILIPVYAFMLLPISASLGLDTNRFFERAAKVQWGLMLCVYCLSYLPALLFLNIANYANGGVVLLVFLILVVEASDVFQYIWGKILGKHKIAPTISPSKTMEGLIGGVLSASLLGAALWWATPFTIWQAGLIALTVNIVGFFGGFVLSAIKRDRGVKDWGSMVNGHGGMLDRMDSLCFAAPIYFHIIRYWWAH